MGEKLPPGMSKWVAVISFKCPVNARCLRLCPPACPARKPTDPQHTYEFNN